MKLTGPERGTVRGIMHLVGTGVAVAFAELSLAALMTGCFSCDEIGCGDTIYGKFEPPISSESIRVNVNADGRTFTCR